MEFNWEFTGTAAFNRDAVAVTALTVELAKAREIKLMTTNAANFGFGGTFPGPASDAPVRQVLAACGYTLGQVPPPAPAAADQ